MEKHNDGKLVMREKITALAFVSPRLIGFVVFTMICMIVSFACILTKFNLISGRMKIYGLERSV